MIQTVWSKGMAPTTSSGLSESLNTVPTRGAFQPLACHHSTQHQDLIASFWVGKWCSVCVEARSTCFGWLVNVEKCDYHSQTQQLRFPLHPDSITLPPLAWLKNHVYVCFMEVMGGAEAWAWSMTLLTQVVSHPAIHRIA